MTKGKLLFLASLSLGTASVAAVTVAKTFFSTSAESSFSYIETDDGNKIYRSSNQRYFVQEIYKESAKTRVLFAVTENNDIYEDLDHVENSMRLSAFVDNGSKAFGKVAWTLNEPATSAGTTWNDQSLLVVRYDNDAADPSYRAYDALTGKLILSYEDFVSQQNPFPAPYIINIPNTTVPNRYVGIVSGNAAHDFDEPSVPPPPGAMNAFLIKYGQTGGLKNKWMIQVRTDEGFSPSVTEVKVVPFGNAPNSKLEVMSNLVTLWDLDGKNAPNQIAGFAFEIHVATGSGEAKIVIPVKNDRLDLDSTALPPGTNVVVIQ